MCRRLLSDEASEPMAHPTGPVRSALVSVQPGSRVVARRRPPIDDRASIPTVDTAQRTVFPARAHGRPAAGRGHAAGLPSRARTVPGARTSR
jgi:hypothetical protein